MRLPAGVELMDLGEHRLRDLGRPCGFSNSSAGVLRSSHRCGPWTRSREIFPSGEFIHRSTGRSPGSPPHWRVAGSDHHRGGRCGENATGACMSPQTSCPATGMGPGWSSWRLRDPDGLVSVVAAVFRPQHSGPVTRRHSGRDAVTRICCWCSTTASTYWERWPGLVTRIERECPGVVVLATSREGMAIDGEQLIALPPLTSGDRVSPSTSWCIPTR